MPHHGNEAEHNDQVNDQPQGESDAVNASAEESGAEGDALAQAEEILNAAGDAEGPEDSGEGASEGDAAASSSGNPEAEELRTDLLRLQAEYVNYRKRVERDRAVAGENATASVISSLLPVLDDIDAARQHGDLEDGPFASIAAKLEGALHALGLEAIRETGVPFDPSVHEALMQVPNAEIPEDHVAQILRSGYRKGDRIIRAAQVVVSTGE